MTTRIIVENIDPNPIPGQSENETDEVNPAEEALGTETLRRISEAFANSGVAL